MEWLCYTFTKFIIYAFIGWLIEVVNEYSYSRKFVNRGFLIGPYCPIYGIGVLLLTSLLNSYKDNILVLFILSVLICMTLEYITSYLMEVLFHARWWNYNNDKYNINGRICLRNAFAFGILGIIIIYLVNPFIVSLLNKININLLINLGIFLMIIFLIDIIISVKVAIKYRKVGIDNYKDNTEEFNKIVKDVLIKNSIFTKRLVRSFPDAKMKKKKYLELYKKKNKQ